MPPASGKGAEPAAEGREGGGAPCILKGPSPALQDTQHPQCSTDNPMCFCHSFGTSYCHTLTTRCKEFPALPHSNLTCYSGSLTAASTKGTFPSLNAEPQLTWCCLTRSLPLPAEQKGNTDSAYSSMHTCDKESSSQRTLSKHDISILKIKNISHSKTVVKTLVSSLSKGQQMQELSSAAPGGAFRNISEQKKKTVVC
ncbi:ZN831 protein, partial [Glareola pratincola]|nr:ZN831 protein [Glareola pratincola]